MTSPTVKTLIVIDRVVWAGVKRYATQQELKVGPALEQLIKKGLEKEVEEKK